MIQRVFSLLFFISIFSFSQNKKFSAEINYQIPIDNNFVGENYRGILDIGLKYRVIKVTNFNLGVSMNAGVLNNDLDDIQITQSGTVNLFSYQPRLFVELDNGLVKNLIPSLGLGYSILSFKSEFVNPSEPTLQNETENYNGFNLNLGIAYNISERVFAQLQYDFIKVGVDNDIPDVKYNTNINMIKIGLGIRL